MTEFTRNLEYQLSLLIVVSGSIFLVTSRPFPQLTQRGPQYFCRKFLKKWKRIDSDSRSPQIPTLTQLLKMLNIQRFWSNPKGEKHIISELSIIVSYSDYMFRPKTLHQLEFQHYYGKKLVLNGCYVNSTYKKSKLRLGESQKNASMLLRLDLDFYLNSIRNRYSH